MIRPLNHSLSAIFAIPLIVGVLSLTGLIVALLGDGAWDVAGWVCIGVSIVVLVWALIARRHR
jgi:hypothetical protein